MPIRRRPFKRPLGERRYRRIFFIAAEGTKTEPQYFSLFNDQKSVIKVECLKGRGGSSPQHVLKRMADHLKRSPLKGADEAWLVVDLDQWTPAQLPVLHGWAVGHPNRGFALSNPKFEYWLLLHFEDGNGIGNSRDCSGRLERCLPDYDKGIDSRKITPLMISEAVRRAKQRDNPPCTDWPRGIGTTVYRLVDKIRES